MNFDIPEEVKTAFGIFLKNGYEAYLVGGCVRDYITNKVPHDFDMTTNALPKDTKRIFEGYKVIETGIKHGTVTVVINSFHIEITTYRIDGKYSDNRRPEEVIFTKNITEDLKRRDFTVNAIAYNPKIGFCDPFFGVRDIERKIISCVGEADKRFNEDGLRILRALRFSSVLGFEIEEKTKKSIHKNKNLLLNISKERIFEELKKTLLGKNIKNILTEYSDVLKIVIPLANMSEKTISLFENVPKKAEFMFACLFFFENGGENKAKKTLNDLKTSNDFKKIVCGMLEATQNEFFCDKKAIIKRILRKEGLENTKNALEILKAGGKSVGNIEKLIEETEKNRECYSLERLAINGNDLLKEGYTGREIKIALEYALDLVIDGEKNEKKRLIDLISKKLPKNDNFFQKTIDIL